MLKRAPLFALVSGIAAVSTLTAADAGRSRALPARDANLRHVDLAQADAAARQVLDRVMAKDDVAANIAYGTNAPGDLCAIGIIPGPASNPSIRLFIVNVVGEDLAFANVDSFLALNASSLVLDSVFDATAPAGGTVTVEYPATGGGVGPAVLSFTGLGPLLAASFNLDPDTYDNPNFASSVLDMNRTIVEVAYDGGRRCRGALAFNGTANASIAFITQTSP
jgi:hypothetical protein